MDGDGHTELQSIAEEKDSTVIWDCGYGQWLFVIRISAWQSYAMPDLHHVRPKLCLVHCMHRMSDQ